MESDNWDSAEEEQQETVPDDLYDEDMDDEDEAFVSEQTGSQGGHRTDAVLNCPGCFTTVCLDCQRHQCYVNQFRAMFVLNCRINYNVKLRMQGKGGQMTVVAGTSDKQTSKNEVEVYNPVHCDSCNT